MYKSMKLYKQTDIEKTVNVFPKEGHKTKKKT